jgi:hypothetical protein
MHNFFMILIYILDICHGLGTRIPLRPLKPTAFWQQVTRDNTVPSYYEGMFVLENIIDFTTSNGDTIYTLDLHMHSYKTDDINNGLEYILPQSVQLHTSPAEIVYIETDYMHVLSIDKQNSVIYTVDGMNDSDSHIARITLYLNSIHSLDTVKENFLNHSKVEYMDMSANTTHSVHWNNVSATITRNHLFHDTSKCGYIEHDYNNHFLIEANLVDFNRTEFVRKNDYQEYSTTHLHCHENHKIQSQLDNPISTLYANEWMIRSHTEHTRQCNESIHNNLYPKTMVHMFEYLNNYIQDYEASCHHILYHSTDDNQTVQMMYDYLNRLQFSPQNTFNRNIEIFPIKSTISTNITNMTVDGTACEKSYTTSLIT